MGQFVEQGYEFDLTADEVDRRLMLIGDFSRPNLLHNSRFQVNQRNTTFPFDFQDRPQTTAGRINEYVFDRWLFNNVGFDSGKITMIDFVHKYGTSFPKFESLIEGHQTGFGQRLWVDHKLKNNNPLFNQDVTISILTAEYGLLSATGHTPTRQDFDNANDNTNVGDNITIPYVNDSSGAFVTLTCKKDSITKAKVQAAFYFQICCKEPVTVIAAKVEIGVGQTLAKKVGNQWVLIDQYNYYDDLKTCQRFYNIFTVPTNAIVVDIPHLTNLSQQANFCINLDNIDNMVFTPSIAKIERMYITSPTKNIAISNENGVIDGAASISVKVTNGSNSNIRCIYVLLTESCTTTLGITGQTVCSIFNGSSGLNGHAYGPSRIILSAEV